MLEIGCGEKKDYRESIGLDLRQTSAVDVIGDGSTLPFRDLAFDIVYSSHTIEHFPHAEVKNVLREWIRVLKVGGTLEIKCPDLRARALLFALKPSWRNVEDIYGAQDYSENLHKSGFSFGMLKDLLHELGMEKPVRVIDGFHGVPFLPNCLHVKAVKRDGNLISKIGG